MSGDDSEVSAKRTISGTAEISPVSHANRRGHRTRFVVQSAGWHRHLKRCLKSATGGA